MLFIGWTSLFILFLASSVAADVLPLSPEIRAHSLPNVDGSPSLAALPRGGFWAAWTGIATTPAPLGGYVVERTFDRSSKPLYPERGLSIPRFPEASDTNVRLLRLPAGRRVAVWAETIGRDGDADGIFAAIFDRRIQRIGEEFQVNKAQAVARQLDPVIAGRKGGFLIVWNDWGADNGIWQTVRGQLFDSSGQRQGGEIVFALAPDDIGFLPQVTALRGSRRGQYLVAWQSQNLEIGEDIAAVFVREDGSVSERFTLNSDVPAGEIEPGIAATPDGFVAVWVAEGPLTNRRDVFMRRFNNEGVPMGDEVRVNTYTADDQEGSIVSAARDGSFVVAWVSGVSFEPELGQDGDDFGLYAQAYSPEGQPVGGEFRINVSTEGRQGLGAPSCALQFVSETDFVVLWREHSSRAVRLNSRKFRLLPDQKLCGDTVGEELIIDVVDALGVLRATTGFVTCDLCSCDVNGSGGIEASDSLLVLKSALGTEQPMQCPPCNASESTKPRLSAR
jgi:hypothetical protein